MAEISSFAIFRVGEAQAQPADAAARNHHDQVANNE
jgi:hypothetical protein